MTRGSGKTQMPLSQGEIEGLRENKRELESVLKDKESYGKGTPAEQLDEIQIKKEINHIERKISEGQPAKTTGLQRDRLAKEAKELEESIREGMPTRDEMMRPTRYPGAVRKHMEWDRRNRGSIERYRFIQRTLNPHNPKYVEELRRDK